MSERKAMRKADTVTLGMAEYRRLLRRIEDAEDLRDLRVAEATATKRDYLLAALVKRILAGEHPARVWREHRAMTLAQLATTAGMQRDACRRSRLAGSLVPCAPTARWPKRSV